MNLPRVSIRSLGGPDIPPCPRVLEALSDALRRPDVTAVDLARLIGQDVGLSAAVMRAAETLASPGEPPNDTASRDKRIGTLTAALARLGFAEAMNHVAARLLENSLIGYEQEDSWAQLPRFWDTASHTAGVCARLALFFRGTSRETAYSFGLFRDCGIPLMARRFGDYMDTLKFANARESKGILQIEEGRYGTHHAVIGSLMARRWGLSPNIVDAILAHHDIAVLTEDAGALSSESRTLVALGLMAEHVVSIHLRQRDESGWDGGRECGREDPHAGNRPASSEGVRHAVGEFLQAGQADLQDIIDDLVHSLGSRLHIPEPKSSR